MNVHRPSSRLPFPIDAVPPHLFAALRERRSAVLQAPPGAGTTTSIPPVLLEQPWLPGHRIIVVEPHGLAARAACARMAALLGEEVGDTVGFRTSSDSRIGPRTRIELVAGDLFLRQVQEAPELPDVGAVLFDRFHERRIDGVLALAFVREAREALCRDTLLLVMSEPMDAAPVAAMLGGGAVPVLALPGDAAGFPVDVRHWDAPAPGTCAADAVVSMVQRALREERGGILAFLPDAAAVLRAAALLGPVALDPGIVLIPLCDEPAPGLLDAAIAPAPSGTRKLVLATALAEAGIGIADIRIVVDGGLIRMPVEDRCLGMTRPVTMAASLDHVERRTAAAGRSEPGVCHRLWSKEAHAGLAPRTPPEIQRVDLAAMVLELAAWGVAGSAAFSWLESPPAAGLDRARSLLVRLEAVDAGGVITPLGKRMARLGLHPRLARLILSGAGMALGGLACMVAALLEEPAFRPSRDGGGADLRPRIDRLLDEEQGVGTAGDDADDPGRIWRILAWRVLERTRSWRQRIGIHQPVDRSGTDRIGELVALAYPDRIARRQTVAPDGAPSGTPGGTPGGAATLYRLADGSLARLPDGDEALATAEWLAVAALAGPPDSLRIALAAPLRQAEPDRDAKR